MGNTDWMGRVKPGIGRRDFLRVGSLSFLGISLRNYLMAAEGLAPKGKAKACIMLWLEGGPSQVDTWDPKLTSNSAFKPISTNVRPRGCSAAGRRNRLTWPLLRLKRTRVKRTPSHPLLPSRRATTRSKYASVSANP